MIGNTLQGGLIGRGIEALTGVAPFNSNDASVGSLSNADVRDGRFNGITGYDQPSQIQGGLLVNSPYQRELDSGSRFAQPRQAEDIRLSQEAVKEADTKLKETTKKNEETISKLRIAEDKYQRNETLNKLMTPLNKEKKEIMVELLESVQTNKLEQAFNKYLPSVLNEDASVRTEKKALNESVKTTEHTGNRVAPASNEQEATNNDVVELNEIRKLAGLN